MRGQWLLRIAQAILWHSLKTAMLPQSITSSYTGVRDASQEETLGFVYGRAARGYFAAHPLPSRLTIGVLLGASPGDCLAHQLLGATRAVGFGSVHPAYPVIEGGAHCPNQLFVRRVRAGIATASFPRSVA